MLENTCIGRDKNTMNLEQDHETVLTRLTSSLRYEGRPLSTCCSAETSNGCGMLCNVNAAKVTNQEFQKKGSEVHEDWKVKWEGAEM